jgi:hypothetical protein
MAPSSFARAQKGARLVQRYGDRVVHGLCNPCGSESRVIVGVGVGQHIPTRDSPTPTMRVCGLSPPPLGHFQYGMGPVHEWAPVAKMATRKTSTHISTCS